MAKYVCSLKLLHVNVRNHSLGYECSNNHETGTVCLYRYKKTLNLNRLLIKMFGHFFHIFCFVVRQPKKKTNKNYTKPTNHKNFFS